MLHLDGSAHAFDTLRIAPGLTGTEQNSGNRTENCRQPDQPQGVGSKELPDGCDHRSPRRRSSIRAQIM